MPAIKLIGFRGEQPSIIPRLLPDAGAQDAINSRLDDGGLTPIRQAVQVSDAGALGDKTIYLHNAEWLTWSGIVHAAPGPVDDARLYYTGDGAPKMLKDGVIYGLAVPRPTIALTATLGGVGAGDVVTRAYVYTWVTSFGEESEPCPASNLIDWQPGNTVTLSGFAATPAARAITTQRIYRTQTGQSGTYLYLIAERAATNATFSDTIAVDAFQEPLPSADWNTPPDGLSGLVAMPNGMMAAFAGRRVYFCEPWRPHAWPEKYIQTVNADIVGLGATGSALVIMTKANPWLAVGSMPEAMQMQKLETNLPCVNGRGIVDMGFAICYPSNEGLVVAYGDGRIGLATAQLFNRDTWLNYSPSTMIGSQHAGRYVAFFDTVSDLGERVAGSMMIEVGQAAFLIRSSAMATAAYFDVAQSALFYMPTDSADIWRFDAPNGARQQQYWKSKPFVLPYPENFGAILIEADKSLSASDTAAAAAYRSSVIAANTALLPASILGELNAAPINELAFSGDSLARLPLGGGLLTVGVYADGVRIKDVLVTNKPTRLPGGFTARTWEIDVTGDIRVTNIVMGKTIGEVANTP